MADTSLIKKLADIPLARAGFDALTMSAPVILQINPAGKWKTDKPENLDEERLRAVVQHLVKSKAVDVTQSCCPQCLTENQDTFTGKSDYLPVIMMPIYPADSCPFDMDCEIAKMEEDKKKKPKMSGKKAAESANVGKVKDSKKIKKRGFQLQRLTDFDLLSQW